MHSASGLSADRKASHTSIYQTLSVSGQPMAWDDGNALPARRLKRSDRHHQLPASSSAAYCRSPPIWVAARPIPPPYRAILPVLCRGARMAVPVHTPRSFADSAERIAVASLAGASNGARCPTPGSTVYPSFGSTSPNALRSACSGSIQSASLTIT